MIIAIEGPDCSGKTTLFNAVLGKLENAVYVPSLGMNMTLRQHASMVSRRDLLWWEALYDQDKLYVCDRHPAVSGPVYDALRGSLPASVDAWYSEVAVFHMKLPTRELEKRLKSRGDDWFKTDQVVRVAALYSGFVKNFDKLVTLNAALPTDKVLAQFLSEARQLCESFSGRSSRSSTGARNATRA